MELIKRVEEADFAQRLRGYDMDEVDQFLESLARDIAQLEQELAMATHQLESGPPGAAAPEPAPAVVAPEPTDPGRPREAAASLHDPDGAVQRMLAIAQRTADEAVREAKAEANRVVSDAELRANTTVAGAEEQRDAILAEAANEARRVAEATRRPLVEEIATLEGSRESLERDVSLLERHLAQQRNQLSASVKRLQQLLEDPESFKIDRAPETSGAVLPAHLRSAPDPPAESPTALEEPDSMAADEPGFDELGGGESHDPAPLEPTWVTADDEMPLPAFDEEAGAPPPIAGVTDLSTARTEVVVEAAAPLPEPEDMPPSLTAVPSLPERSPLDGLGPPPEVASSLPIVGLPEPADPYPGGLSAPPPEGAPLIDDLLGGDEGDDRFLDELRRASDEADLGPDDDADADRAMAAFFDQDEEDGRRPRFGRRN